MKIIFSGSDNGIFVFGRDILKKNKESSLEFRYAVENSQEFFCESRLWEKGLQEILKNKTRFGRIALIYDRKNKKARSFIENLDIKEYEYSPKEKRSHTEKIPRIFPTETQVLHEMANEGLSDTVEFRRLSRKFLRKAKHANADTFFFLENIFAEEKTRKILDHITSSQRKNVFPVDFLDESFWNKKSEKREMRIVFSEENPEFLKSRAEMILRTKLSKGDFHKE